VRDGGGGAGGGDGAGGAMRADLGDKKRLWKLVNGKPRPVLIKPGLTDGSSTQLLEGDLSPGDLLVTEIIGAPTGPARKVGAF
jgi:HlyD family secretion protein